jgi:TPR repeat protein
MPRRDAACLALALALSLPAGASARPPEGNKYALLVGVKDYRHASLAPLRYTENDVEGLAKALRQPPARFASVRVLTTARGHRDRRDAPTADNVRRELKALLAGKGRHDTVLVAFAGHGLQLEVEDPDGKGEPRTYTYFCPADADLAGPSHATGKAPKLIHLNDLFKDLGSCGATNKLVLIDACRNEAKAASATRNFDVGNVTIPRGVAALFSCAPGQRAWETAKLGGGHGVFFYQVMEALAGKAKNEEGEVAWDGLTAYVRRNVEKHVPEVIGGGARQTPHAVMNIVGSPVLVGKLPEDERLFQRGHELYQGDGKSVDWVKAADLFRQASEKGHDVATAYYAWCLHSGRGVKVDKEEAERLGRQAFDGVKRAARGGQPEAQNALFRLYYIPIGVKKDVNESLRWLRLAAARELPDALYNMGRMHEYGTLARDNDEAARWMRKAADRDHALAQTALAEMYERGAGVPKDGREARRWYRLAAEAGFPQAKRRLAELGG